MGSNEGCPLSKDPDMFGLFLALRRSSAGDRTWWFRVRGIHCLHIRKMDGLASRSDWLSM